MSEEQDLPDPTAPTEDSLISDALASIPAMLRYRPAPGTVAVCLPMAGARQVDAIFTVDTESELTKAGAQLTPFLRSALAAGADRMIVALGVVYPTALITAQPGFALLKTMSARLTEYNMEEVPIAVAGGFVTPGAWLHLGQINPDEPVAPQLLEGTTAIPDWRDHLTSISLAARGQHIADDQASVGSYWNTAVTPPAGSGAGPDDDPARILTADQALIGFTYLVEYLAHQHQPVREPDMLGRVAAGLDKALAGEPLLGFALAPAITSHPDQAYTVLSLIVPLTRGLGRSYLLDWATIAALLSGQQRSAEVALTAAASSRYADGPTELSALLYGGLAGATWDQTLPVILESGAREMRELPDHHLVGYILSQCAETAVRSGHQLDSQSDTNDADDADDA